MATTEGQVTAGDEVEQPQAEDSRDAWLEVAASDVDSGLSALATAARRGRPLRRRPEEG